MDLRGPTSVFLVFPDRRPAPAAGFVQIP